MRQISSRQDCDRAHKAAESTSAISRPRLHKRANFLRMMRRTTIGDHEKFSLGALDQALQDETMIGGKRCGGKRGRGLNFIGVDLGTGRV